MVFLVLAPVMLVATVASALGRVWGPVLLGFGFAVWEVLLGFGGNQWQWATVVLLCLCASVVEFAAAAEFWKWRGTRNGPPVRWRAWAGLVGTAGSLLGGYLLLLLMQLVAWFANPV